MGSHFSLFLVLTSTYFSLCILYPATFFVYIPQQNIPKTQRSYHPMEVPRSESPLSCSSSSSSFSSPFSSCLSCSNSTQSLTSSSNSTPLSFPNSQSRCEGLDMLVKAVYYVVAGSVVGVPYIQRRVIRRRKRPIAFGNLIIRGFGKNSEEVGKIEENSDAKKRTKRRRAAKAALPSKYQDSVLHEWKPPTKRQRGSGQIRSRSGL